MRARADLASSDTGLPGSWPSTMFSQTVRFVASMNAWKTMPIPTAIASFGESNSIGVPPTVIVPSLGLWAP